MPTKRAKPGSSVSGICKRCGMAYEFYNRHRKNDCTNPLPWNRKRKDPGGPTPEVAEPEIVEGTPAQQIVEGVRDKLLRELVRRTNTAAKLTRLENDELMALIKSCQSTIQLEVEHTLSGKDTGATFIVGNEEMFQTRNKVTNATAEIFEPPEEAAEQGGVGLSADGSADGVPPSPGEV